MSELPKGWINVPFLEIFDIQGGTQPPKKEFLYQETQGYIRLLQIRDFGEKPLPTFVPFKKSLKVCKKDDILIGRYGASVGRICTGMEGAYNVALAKVIMPEILHKRFVYYLLKSDVFQAPILSTERSAQDGFNKDDLERIIVPLPPLNEQRRIVAKLEKLLVKCEACKQRLDKIPVILKRFRQSILAAACSGRLTANWREQNPDLEPASELFVQIWNKKLEKYEAEFAAAKIKGRKSPPKPKTFGIPQINNEDSFDIPESWQWLYFGELIASIRSGSTAVPSDETSAHPILRSSSVRPGLVDLQDIKFLTEEQSLNSSNFLEEGDLLFTRLSGSLEFVGNCGIVRNLNRRKVQYPDRLFCAKLVNSELSAYSEFCFASPILRDFLLKNAKSSAGHQRISIGAITEQPIPLPPLAEQKEIVQRVEKLFKLVDQIEQRYQKARAYVDKLPQSILAKAFRGELVPQDPNDESASILLERIRAEREQQISKGSRGGKGSRGNVRKKGNHKEEFSQLNLGDVG